MGLWAYGLLRFAVLPWVIEGQVKSFLKERLSIAASIDNVCLNPFTLSVAVEGLALTDADSHRLMSFKRLYINFQLSSIFRRAASFKAVHLDFRRYSETDSNIARIAAQWEASAGVVADNDPVEDEEAESFPLIIADFRLQ